MAIKISINKLWVGLPFKNMKAKMEGDMISYLPILFKHSLAVSSLAHHHNDPFDSLHIAQRKTDQLILITKDEKIKPYNIQTLRKGHLFTCVPSSTSIAFVNTFTVHIFFAHKYFAHNNNLFRKNIRTF